MVIVNNKEVKRIVFNWYLRLNSTRKKDDSNFVSLEQQYNNLRKKFNKKFDNTGFETFISYLFSANQCIDYIASNPSHLRQYNVSEETTKNGSVLKIIKNVVIIRRGDKLSEEIIGKRDILLLCDLEYKDNNIETSTFIVKNIDFIDNADFRDIYDIKISAVAWNILTTNDYNQFVGCIKNNMNKSIKMNIVNQNFIADIVAGKNNDYYVKKYKNIYEKYQKWKEYINFRKKYLDYKKGNNIKISNVKLLENTYIIPSWKVKFNDLTDCKLFDDENAIKEDSIILTKNLDGATTYPLLMIDIEYKESELTVSKKNKKYDIENTLASLTNDTVLLCSGKEDIALDERYKFCTPKINVPDLTQIDKYYDSLIEKRESEIKNAFNSQKEMEIENYEKLQLKEIVSNENKRIDEIKNSLYKLACTFNGTRPQTITRHNYHDNVIFPYATRDYRNINSINNRQVSISEEEKAEIEKKRNELNEELENINKIIKQKIDLYKSEDKDYLNFIKEVNDKYNAEIEKIILDEGKRIESKREKDKEDEKARKTTVTFSIYFRIIPESISNVKKFLNNGNRKISLSYNFIPEEQKIIRQERALDSFIKGSIRNPILTKYLFEPEHLDRYRKGIDGEIEWCLESLNDRQKEAVRKALESNSLFLIQGPPGTGKTQVISEIVSQFAKQGKKVLISSETHKAIDNVFERLPKTPEIRPLRLIPSESGKESDYSTDKLVDNFYKNIKGSIYKEIDIAENFSKAKDNFYDDYKKLELQNQKVTEKLSKFQKLNVDIKKIEKKINNVKADISQINNDLSNNAEKIKEFDTLNTKINNDTFMSINEDLYNTPYIKLTINNIKRSVNQIFTLEKYKIFKVEKLNKLMSISPFRLKDYIDVYNWDLHELIKKKNEILHKIKSLEIDSNDSDYVTIEKKQLLNELADITKKINSEEVSSQYTIHLNELINIDYLKKESVGELAKILTSLKSDIKDEKERNYNLLQEKLKGCYDERSDLEKQLISLKKQKDKFSQEVSTLMSSSGYNDYEEQNSRLIQEINSFMNKFNIIKEYSSSTEALQIINDEWKRMEKEFNNKDAEIYSRIPIYKKIIKYLSKEDVLKEDKQKYTKLLFNCVNVFGMTCTSRDWFRQDQLATDINYNLDDFDIKSQGIDVVIIDEVSKSSFLDLLIPMLYGKTVILVGDHKQLPPMYDLKHLNEEEIDNLNIDDFNKEKNREFTKLYEECFFKTLFELVPEDNKVMLNKQYRCHSQIMDVFNCFYRDYNNSRNSGLTIGKQNQDDEKQHYLSINVRGNNIIDKNKHIYFVNCNGGHEQLNGSKSLINKEEARTVVKLIELISNEYFSMSEKGKIKEFEINEEKEIDTRPSIGVICTYGDQARQIKNLLNTNKNIKKKAFNKLNENKFIVSTVDDFQGDERDIIILSMVQNNSGYVHRRRRRMSEFMRKLERINVALSRARKLLIIVGNRKFLCESQVELDNENYYNVYENIINIIDLRGRVLESQEILEGDGK